MLLELIREREKYVKKMFKIVIYNKFKFFSDNKYNATADKS